MALTDDIPSFEVDVLQKNMQVTDEIVNSTETTAENRHADNGNFTTRTFLGMNDEVNDLISEGKESFDCSIVYMGVIELGAFASGIDITLANQSLEYNGELYRTTEPLPYTTTGTTPDNDSADWVVVVLEAEEMPEPDVYLPLSSGKFVDTLAGDYTFSRASTSTAINKSGVIVDVAADEPAITKNGVSIYDSYTNLCLYSSDMTDSTWSKFDSTVAEDPTVLSSDQISSSYKVSATGSGTFALANQIGSITDAGQVITMYVEVRAGIETSVFVDWVSLNGGTTQEFRSLVDLTDGSITSNQNEKIEVTKLVNGWWGISISSTKNNTGNIVTRMDIQFSSTPSNGDYFYINNAMIIEGSFLGAPFVKTSGVAVTRAADLLRIPVVNNLPPSGDAWTISIKCAVPIDTGKIIYLWNFDVLPSSAVLLLRRFSSNALQLIYDKSDGSDRSLGVNGIDDLDHVFTVVYDPNYGVIFYIDGVIAAENTTSPSDVCFFDTTGEIDIGERGGTFYINSEISDFNIWHQALTAEQVARLGSAE